MSIAQEPQKTSEPKIRVDSLVKIFGKSPREGLKLLREGHDRDSILEKTGNVVGVGGVSFEIQQGELFVIMGLSGSGKSTLIRCLNRLIEPTSGQVIIDDEDIAHVNSKRLREVRRTKMAMVFQKFALFPHLTVAENTEYGLNVRGLNDRKRRHKALETLEIVGLHKWADRYPSELSGGMQQRVGLARALATDPDILLMDEAFGALDPLIRRDMQAELLRLQDELQKTVVFISHDIHEALKLGDRVAVMKDGYFVQVGTPEELVTNPADNYIRDFMLDVNRAQVLKTGSITRKTIPFILGHGSAQTAFEQMQRYQRKEMYVVNQDNTPIGIVTLESLTQALKEGKEDIKEVMETDFPKVKASTTIEDVAHLCQQRLPLAIIDDEGDFKGVVEHSDILASIGRLQDVDEESDSEESENEPQKIVA
ncbi:glycine betaine/L-proline ABC transporter ATP-binding protein [Euhalothece natronophila Z-M001]|uniref:Glycine betaine/L-proline ABC transporter ATP-binding protein n=1 Tax=Euhalothece natronophila Z-M001 TaxID=522448 RepID=A0A5B8NJD6_9CHRO|nr:glycine betaine/L-proline ABC transporter ATP-binding protein [Euhalothece natronophila]QDZ39077.1 glycine betaine/L-proline ABC transporter ATP-binding protein [Euhalothece natronophila Z-M001]